MVEIVSAFPFEFYGSRFVAYLADDRNFYIRLDQISEAIGLDYSGQLRRVKEDEAISDKLTTIMIETPYRDSLRKKEVNVINLRALPYWLGTIDANRAKPELYARIVLYKREFADAAWFIFRSDMLSKEMMAELDSYATPAEREMADLMTSFHELKKRVDLLSGRTDEELAKLGLTLKEMGGRFSVLEARLLDELNINKDEAWRIDQMVKCVGIAMHESNKSKYPKSRAISLAMADFKEAFKIPVYTALHPDQYEAAVEFLKRRYQRYKPGESLPDVFTGGHQTSLF
jgi:hypothetical protein